MPSRLLFAALLIAMTIGVTARPTAQPAAPQKGSTTTLDDQAELAITVYNSDLALVRDVRNVQIARGTSDLQFMDIAATVNPATVHFRSLTEPGRVSVLEQNYEYDLLEPEKLLRKYVGREVTLVRTRLDGSTSRDEDVKARLISYNNAPVWEIGGEIVTGMPATHIRFPELPGNLFSHPTLIWTLDNTGGTRHRVEASYLARSLSWIADYVLTVSRDEKTADVDGWVTVTNNSGTAFRHAQLQLVAGDLNRVKRELRGLEEAVQLRAPAAAPPMSQEAFSEYHLYTLARKTTVNNAETKQVSMLGASAFPVQKRYVVDGNFSYYRSARTGAPIKDNVEVFYQFRNEEKAGLGMPMPAGTVRVYQADSKGGLQFVGEDRIDHTPKDETLNLKIGNAFDVVCERKQTDFERIANNVYEFGYEIALRNHKDTAITVEVNEPIGGSWRMLESSHPFDKTAAFAAQFKVPVAANGAATLKYRVRVTY
ncbi:MAG TPA: DUF4139 domain-containing protein [Vicinamibacterales bacterium]|jgi:hypothetical protein